MRRHGVHVLGAECRITQQPPGVLGGEAVDEAPTGRGHWLWRQVSRRACPETDELTKAVLGLLSIQLDRPAIACGLTDVVD